MGFLRAETPERLALIKLLKEKGFTDGSDMDLANSLFNYGILRNPTTGETIFCCDIQNMVDSESDAEPVFDITTITLDDVIDGLGEMPLRFFRAYPKDNEFHTLNGAIAHLRKYPDSLASTIRDMQDENDYWNMTHIFNKTIEDLMRQFGD